MLWDLIRDFFVQNIFGGYDSNLDSYSGFVGMGFDHGDSIELYSNDFGFQLSNSPSVYDNVSPTITLGDWLSTTFTIISLILITIFLILFIKWIFKLFAGLFYR